MLWVFESNRRKLSRGFCVWMRIDWGVQSGNDQEAGVTWVWTPAKAVGMERGEVGLGAIQGVTE